MTATKASEAVRRGVIAAWLLVVGVIVLSFLSQWLVYRIWASDWVACRQIQA